MGTVTYVPDAYNATIYLRYRSLKAYDWPTKCPMTDGLIASSVLRDTYSLGCVRRVKIIYDSFVLEKIEITNSDGDDLKKMALLYLEGSNIDEINTCEEKDESGQPKPKKKKCVTPLASEYIVNKTELTRNFRLFYYPAYVYCKDFKDEPLPPVKDLSANIFKSDNVKTKVIKGPGSKLVQYMYTKPMKYSKLDNIKSEFCSTINEYNPFARIPYMYMGFPEMKDNVTHTVDQIIIYKLRFRCRVYYRFTLAGRNVNNHLT